jgi:hypothetical protein
MNNRRLSLLVLLVVVAVVASVEWYLAAERPIAPAEKPGEAAVFESCATVIHTPPQHG